MNLIALPQRVNRPILTSVLAIFALSASTTHCGSDDPAPPTSGVSGSSGANGTSGAAGSSGTAGSSGASGTLGSSGSGPGGSSGSTSADSGNDTSETGGSSGNPDASDAAEDVFVDMTVRGTLKTTRGRALEGATVVIGNNTVVSNARGEFTVENVPATYDLWVLPNPSSGQKQIYVYIGLASRRPTARIAVTDTFLRATVQGTLSPGYPQQPSQVTGIGYKSVNQDASGSFILEGSKGPQFGPLDVAWTAGATVTGQLFALQWSVGSTQFPTGYRGWATQSLSLTSGMPASSDLVLGTLSQREVSGTTRFPQGIGSIYARLDVENIRVFDNSVPFSPGAAAVSYAYPIPIGVGSAARILSFHATVGTAAVASTELSAKLNDSTSTVDFELPLPPSQALPIDMATGVDGNTEFAWTAVPNTAYVLGVVNAATNTGYAIHTASTNAKVPDLSSKGIPWAAGNHLWAVQALGPADSVDAFVTGTSILEERGRQVSTVSAYRRFTAKVQ